MWIEIVYGNGGTVSTVSHATYVACGLKYYFVDPNGVVQRSCHVCGMWIEIDMFV